MSQNRRMQADIRPSDTVPTRFILFQNGSAVAENITTFHPNGCPIVVNIHLSPNGTCFIVEYLNERSIPYARKVFAASLGLGAEVEDSYVKRSASPKRSSYFRDSQPCPANISTLKSTLSDTGDGYQLSQQLEYHLTSAVTTDLRQPVMRLLAFRNLHAERPHMPADLLDEKQIMQTLLVRTSSASSVHFVATPQHESCVHRRILRRYTLDGLFRLLLLLRLLSPLSMVQ